MEIDEFTRKRKSKYEVKEKDALMYCAYVYTKHAIYVFDKKTKLIDAINNDNQLTASHPLYTYFDDKLSCSQK